MNPRLDYSKHGRVKKIRTARKSKHPPSLPGLVFLNLSCIFNFFPKDRKKLEWELSHFNNSGSTTAKPKHQLKESSKPKQNIIRSLTSFHIL